VRRYLEIDYYLRDDTALDDFSLQVVGERD